MRRRSLVVPVLVLSGLLAAGALPGPAGDPAAAAPGSPFLAPVPAADPAPPNGMLGFNDDGEYEVFWPGDPATARIVRSQDEGSLRYHDPAWSPDGRALATIRHVGGVQTIALSDWSGRPMGQLRAWPGGDLTDIWWLDAPDRLLVAQRLPDGGSQLWHVDPDDGDRELVSVVDERLDNAAVSPDGTSLAFLRRVDDQSQVVRHDIAEGTSTLLFSHSYPIYDVDWSPDGTTVALVVGNDLWLVEPDGSGAHEVVDGEEHWVRDVAWSPDSRLVGFTALSTEVSVAALDVASGVVTPVLEERWALSNLTWQPLPDCSVTGTDGDDTLVGSPGDDVICAGAGDDVVAASPGVDIVLAGDGADRIDLSTSAAVTVDLTSSWAGSEDGRTMLSSVGIVTGSRFGDRLLGDEQDNSLRGGGGADLLVGGQGADDLRGGRGRDTVSYHRRDDPGLETRTPVQVDLASGAAVTRDGETDALQDIENVQGSGGPDVIRGDDSANTLVAGGDRALVEGRGGDDHLHTRGMVTFENAPGPVAVDFSVSGDERVAGADGNDLVTAAGSVRGSRFDDVIVASAAVEGLAGDDLLVSHWLNPVDGGAGTDTLDGSALRRGIDLRPGDEDTPGRWHQFGGDGRHGQPVSAIERFRLTSRRDVFAADGAGGSWVDSGRGVDVLRGGAGPDVLLGGAGDDVLEGRGGRDRLRPGPGADLVDGGSDHDHCGAGPDDVVRRCEVRIGERD